MIMPGGMIVAPVTFFPVPILYMKGDRIFIGYRVIEEKFSQPSGQPQLERPIIVEALSGVTGEERFSQAASLGDVARFVVFGKSFDPGPRVQGPAPLERPSMVEAFRDITGEVSFSKMATQTVSQPAPKTTSFWDVLRFVIFGRSFDPESDQHRSSKPK